MKASPLSFGEGMAPIPRPLKNPSHKYIHVHHYKGTKLFGAWFNDPTIPGKKKRVYFGSHQTAYLAARAQDRAALKYMRDALDPSTIHLNFKAEDYTADEELRNMLTNEEFGILLCKESRLSYTKMERTPCLKQFIDEECHKGNLVDNDARFVKITLQEYLDGVMKLQENTPQPMQQDPTMKWGLYKPRTANKRVAPIVPTESVRTAVVMKHHYANRAYASTAAPEAVELRHKKPASNWTLHSTTKTTEPAALPALISAVPRKKRKVNGTKPTDLPASSTSLNTCALWSNLELDVVIALQDLQSL